MRHLQSSEKRHAFYSAPIQVAAVRRSSAFWVETTMSRSAVLAWLLAVSCLDSEAAAPIHILSVFVGENVRLPCSCSKDTKRIVWQIGEEIVVNHCCEDEHPLHESYVNRTQVFLSKEKGNCSLLLRDVSLKDRKNFTCYIFDGNGNLLNMQAVVLHVNAANRNVAITEPTQGFAVGVPLSLLLLILIGLIGALLIRKRRQGNPSLVVIQDPQAKLAMLNHSTV